MQSIIRPNEKPIKRFYSKVANQSFMVPVLDEEGNTVKKVDGEGKKIFVDTRKGKIQAIEEESWSFAPVSQSVSKGTLSAFFVYKDTPQRVVDVLERLAADKRLGWLMTEEDKEKTDNPKAYAEKLERAKREKELSEIKELAEENKKKAKELEGEVKAKDKALKEMQAKLKKIEEAKK